MEPIEGTRKARLDHPCGKLVLSLPRNASKRHHPPAYCKAHCHANSEEKEPPHRRHDNQQFRDRTTRQPLPTNNPASLQAQIDEGGNPFGNIPTDVELCFENSRMLQEREDQFQLKHGEKTDSTTRQSPPTSCQSGFKLLEQREHHQHVNSAASTSGTLATGKSNQRHGKQAY